MKLFKQFTHIKHLYHTVFWKESSNSNHLYLKSLSIKWPHHMDMEIQILVWNRYKNVVSNGFKIWL